MRSRRVRGVGSSKEGSGEVFSPTVSSLPRIQMAVKEALNTEDHNGYTPFLLAVKYCKLNVVMLLVEKYDVTIDQPTTQLGVTPLELAHQYQAEEVIKYLGNQYVYEDEDTMNVTMDRESSLLAGGEASPSISVQQP